MTSDQFVPCWSLRDGKSLGAKVLDPFALADPEEVKRLRQSLLRTMASDRVEVIIKRQTLGRFSKPWTAIEATKLQRGRSRRSAKNERDKPRQPLLRQLI